MARTLSTENRQKILAKAPHYYGYARNWIESCAFLTEGPRTLPIIFDGGNRWEGKCAFSVNGDEVFILKFRDLYRQVDSEPAKRAFSYDFRKSGAQVEVFRFDTHGRFCELDAPCHVHPGKGADIRVQEGDLLLNNYSMKYMTLCDVAILIENYLQEGVLPWQ